MAESNIKTLKSMLKRKAKRVIDLNDQLQKAQDESEAIEFRIWKAEKKLKK